MSTLEDPIPENEPVVASPHRLSFFAKLWNLFVDPRKTFSSIQPNHEWAILWLLVSLITIGGYLPVKDIVKKDQVARIEQQLKQNPQTSAEQKEQILERVESQFDNPLYLLFVPVSQIFVLFIAAGILLFLGNIVLGGDTGFLRMLNAYAWIMMLVIPATIVTVPMVIAKGSMDVSLGLGVLTSPDTGAFLKKLLSSFELFGLWQVWLSSVAVAVLAQVEARKAFWSVFMVWLLWVVIQGGLATLGVQLGGS